MSDWIPCNHDKDEFAYFIGKVYCPRCDKPMERVTWERNIKTIKCNNSKCSLFNELFKQPKAYLSFAGQKNNEE